MPTSEGHSCAFLTRLFTRAHAPDRQDEVLTDVHDLRLFAHLECGHTTPGGILGIAVINDFLEFVRVSHLIALGSRGRLVSIGECPTCEFNERLDQRAHGWYAGHHYGDVALQSSPCQAENAREGHVSRWRVQGISRFNSPHYSENTSTMIMINIKSSTGPRHCRPTLLQAP